MASSDRTLQPRLPSRAFASAALAGVVARRQRGLLGRSTGGRDDDGQVTPNARAASAGGGTNSTGQDASSCTLEVTTVASRGGCGETGGMPTPPSKPTPTR